MGGGERVKLIGGIRAKQQERKMMVSMTKLNNNWNCIDNGPRRRKFYRIRKKEEVLVTKDYSYRLTPVANCAQRNLQFMPKYRVSTKKVLHKGEEEMHKEMKMTSQRAENLV